MALNTLQSPTEYQHSEAVLAGVNVECILNPDTDLNSRCLYLGVQIS